MRYKYYKKYSRFGLAWSRPCADRGLSRPTSVFRTTICVCKILSSSAEIWQYEGQKPVLSKNRARPSLCLGLAVNKQRDVERMSCTHDCLRRPRAVFRDHSSHSVRPQDKSCRNVTKNGTRPPRRYPKRLRRV